MDMQSSMALQTMQKNIEGVRKRINRKPLMFLTVQKFQLKEEGSINVREFCLEGLQVTGFLEIPGSQKQIMKEFGQEAARKLMNKAKEKAPFRIFGKRTPQPEAKPPPVALAEKTDLDDEDISLMEQEDKPGAPKIQTAHVQMTMKLTKAKDADKVTVKIRELTVGQNTFTSQKTAKRILSAPGARTIIEAGVSKIVSKGMSKKLGKEKNKLRNKFCFLCQGVMRCLRPRTAT